MEWTAEWWRREFIDLADRWDREVEPLIEAVRAVLAPDVVSPFCSAWEMDHDVDGEALYERLKKAAAPFLD